MDNVSRFEKFYKFCERVRCSGKHLIVGIDIAKDKYHAFFSTAYGKILCRTLVFTNDLTGYQRLVDQTKLLLKQYQLKQAVFSLEPSGNYHKPLTHWLIHHNYLVVMVAGKAVKDNRELINSRRDKNDTKDSANAAVLVSQGKCQFYKQPDTTVIALRHLMVVRKQLKKEEHQLRMRIRNGLIAKDFPELDRHSGSCLEEAHAIVRWHLYPRRISGTDSNLFLRHVTATGGGVRQVRPIKAIGLAASQSVGLTVDTSACYEAKLLIGRLKIVKDQISQTMQQIKQLCQTQPGYHLLLSIPGFGPYIAALVLAKLADPYRFASRKQVIRLAGLDLNATRSGKKNQDSEPAISKKGDTDLRDALYHAALIASYKHEGFRRLHHRTQEDCQGERGIKSKARVKLAAKMLILAWSMLKNNEPFDETRLLAESGHRR